MNILKNINPKVKAYIVADGFYYAGYNVVTAFLSILVATKIAPGRLDLVGYLIAYYMIVRAATEVPLSRFSKGLKIPSKARLVAYSYMLYGVAVLMLGYSTQVWHIFAIQTITAIIDATAYPPKWTLFAKIVDKGKEELEWGLEDTFSMIMPAIFTAIAGLVSEKFGLQYAFLLFAFLLVTSGIKFLAINKAYRGK